MHQRKVRALALGLLGTAAITAAVAASEEDFQEVDKKWNKSPASYLTTDEETKEFRSLKTDEEREAFVARFWARRDPTPETEANEFRDRFYRRVEAADEALKQKGIPAGWKSDPGRVLILLGPPSDMKTEEGGSAAEEPDLPSGPSGYEASTSGGSPGGTSGSGGGGKWILVYGDLTGLGLPENLELEFQQEGLSYQLATRVDLTTDAIRGLDPEVLAREFPVGKAEEEKISLAPQEAPPPAAAAPVAGGSVQRNLLMQVLGGGEPESALPFEAAVDYYKAIGDMTYVAVTVGIDVAGLESQGLTLSDLHPVAALQDTADPQNLFLYDSDDLFAPGEAGMKADTDGLVRFQAGDGVKPGQYEIVMGFVNTDGSVAGIRSTTLDVPDFATGIQISSITLTQKWEATDEGSDDVKRPYVLGNRRVIPRLNQAYEPGANLVLYYQVYNAEMNGGAPNLRISYNFYQKRGTRYVRRGTAPPQDGVQDQVQIYELPLQGWPKGEYKLKVTVTDNVTGAFTEREVPFEVG